MDPGEETMSIEQAVEAVVIEITRLDVKPGETLYLGCPDEWTIADRSEFAQLVGHYLPAATVIAGPKLELSVIASDDCSETGVARRLNP
jgi:hypothetical protein